MKYDIDNKNWKLMREKSNSWIQPELGVKWCIRMIDFTVLDRKFFEYLEPYCKARDDAYYLKEILEGIVADRTPVGPFLGPYSSLVGRFRVTGAMIRQGAAITSMSAANRRVAITRPRYIKNVHDYYPGYITYNKGQTFITNPTLVWTGSGGYWCETDMNNIEYLDVTGID